MRDNTRFMFPDVRSRPQQHILMQLASARTLVANQKVRNRNPQAPKYAHNVDLMR